MQLLILFDLQEISIDKFKICVLQSLDNRTCVCSLSQRQVGRNNFSIWRHCVDQVYLGYNHNNLNTVYAFRVSVAEVGRMRKLIFCLHLSPTSEHNLRDFLRNVSYVWSSWPEPTYLPYYQCCGSGPFFSDPVVKIRIRIRIRVTQKRPDPDPT